MTTLGIKEEATPALADGFLRSLDRFPTRAALCVDGEILTYERLGCMASGIASAVLDADQNGNPLVGVLAHRSVTAYAGVLGSLFAGKGYVPLNPKLPIDRLAKIFLQSGSPMLLAGKETVHLLEPLLAHV